MKVKGSCHCKATQFELNHAPTSVTRCNCSFCTKRGALHAYCKPDQFKLTTVRDRVSTYQWRSYVVLHHYCAICGCGTYTETPEYSDKGVPDFNDWKISVNARLLDDFDLNAVEVLMLDGQHF